MLLIGLIKTLHPKDVPTYIKVRSEILGDVRPAFMLLVAAQLFIVHRGNPSIY